MKQTKKSCKHILTCAMIWKQKLSKSHYAGEKYTINRNDNNSPVCKAYRGIL